MGRKPKNTSPHGLRADYKGRKRLYFYYRIGVDIFSLTIYGKKELEGMSTFEAINYIKINGDKLLQIENLIL